MDFVNRIVSRKGAELPSKSNVRPSSNIRRETNPQPRLAEKLDAGFDFNFPAIPEYEGIQNLDRMKDLSKPSQINHPQSFNYLPKPDIFSKAYTGGVSQPSPGERTNTSIGSIN
jgi:hypothetical protein